MTLRQARGSSTESDRTSIECARPSRDLAITKTIVSSRLRLIPSTRFYGSKRRLLGWLLDTMWPLQFETVLEPFGGTASVSLLFRLMGKQVTFHDGLHCNAISARALLGEWRASNSDIEPHLKQIKPKRGFIASAFSGKYFTTPENQWLDGAAEYINSVEDPFQRELLSYCLFQACLRKRPFNAFHRANLSIRLNKTVKRSFGNATTWSKSFAHHMRDIRNNVDGVASISAGTAVVLRPMDIFDLPTGHDLVYLDPPYLRRDRSPERYVRMYHFVEGLARYNEWPQLVDAKSPLGALPISYHPRDWELKSSLKGLLEKLIERHSGSTVVLSYVCGGYPGETELRRIFKKNFSRIAMHKKQLPHALSRRSTTELIIVGIP